MKPTCNDLIEALRKFGRAEPKRPPGKDWFTVKELAAQEKQHGKPITVPAMMYRIRMAQQRGVVIETAIGTMPDKDGFAKRAVFFRLSTNGKK